MQRKGCIEKKSKEEAEIAVENMIENQAKGRKFRLQH